MSRWSVHTKLVFLSAIICSCAQQPRDDSQTTGPLFSENIRPTGPRTPEEERKGFILPPGFEIELFASEPDIDKPINLTFDASGRMWVTSSFEYPFPTRDKPGTDRLTIVEDTDGDGKADKFTDVSDSLNIPIGILPLNDGAISFSIPNVYRLADTENDGHPEGSRFLLGPFGYQDTHGMVSNLIRGYDGWVHACHGFTNKSTFAGTDGDTITLVSGNTFRFRLDGSRVEQMTFGQVNPFGLVFDVLGYVYSTDSHSSPLYQLIRGGDYPHFGKVSIMGFAPDMKPLADEATSLCGITQYADVLFPDEFQDNFFIGDVVKSRVHRYSATWKGSSPVGKSEVDFVKSEDPWFRPVNIKLGPDGALYVADFYNAIIGHYEVSLDHPKRDKQRGRIWRITYDGDDRKVTDLFAAGLPALIDALNHDNLPTRVAATDQITDRIGGAAVDALVAELSNPETAPRKYIHCMWALHRLGSSSRHALTSSMSHSDSIVRVHAMRVLNEQEPDSTLYPLILSAVNDESPHVQRVAVELLTKYPRMQSVDSALAVLRRTDPTFDNHLFYTARLVTRNILRDEMVLKDVVAKTWNEQEAMFLAGVMVDVPMPASAKFLSDFMATSKLPAERVAAAYAQIARFTAVGELERIAARGLSGDEDINLRSAIYKGLVDGLNQRGANVKVKAFDEFAPYIAEAILKKYPPTDLADSGEKVTQQTVAVEIAGDYQVRSLEPALRGFLEQGPLLSWNIRLAALRSLMKIDPKNACLAAMIIRKDSVQEYQRRIATVMGEFPNAAVNRVFDTLKNIPGGVQEAVVIALARSVKGKDIVFGKVRRGELLPRVLTAPRAEEALLAGATRQQQQTLAMLTADLEPISAIKQELIQKRYAFFEDSDKTKFNLDSGRMTFEQNCGVCHKTGGAAGVGPQLDGIRHTGARGLIEKILDPNRNISQAFQNYAITLKDGSVKNGLYRRDEGEAKVFADLTGKEFTVRRGDIAEQKLSKYTLMPDSFGATIEERDFYSLINYLMSL